MHSLLVNDDVQRFKRLDRNCVAMLVVGMAAFNSWTAWPLRNSSDLNQLTDYYARKAIDKDSPVSYLVRESK